MTQAFDLKVRAILRHGDEERSGTVVARVYVDLGTVGWPDQKWGNGPEGSPPWAEFDFETLEVLEVELVPPGKFGELKA